MNLVEGYTEVIDKFKRALENVDERIEYVKLHPEVNIGLMPLVYARDKVYRMELITIIEQLRRERELVLSIRENRGE